MKPTFPKDAFPRLDRARHRPFFEGWYYKVVDAEGRQSLAVIPGAHLAKKQQERDYSFVQVFDGASGEVIHQHYPREAFRADPASDPFQFSIGPSVFSGNQLKLSLATDSATVRGSMDFDHFHSWPTGFLSPGAMGWFRWLPGLPCYQAVLSLRHKVQGKLWVNEQVRDFDLGTGYLEKSWGRSFPKAWLWMQCHHFQSSEASLFLAVATVPILGNNTIPGVTAALLTGEQFYRFGSYKATRIAHLDIQEDRVSLVLRGFNRILEIQSRFAPQRQGESSPVLAPEARGLQPRIYEVLQASVEVKLTVRGVVRFHETGEPAALDLVNHELLLSQEKSCDSS